MITTSKYYIILNNDELPAPRYVERGLGIGGVKITDSLSKAKRYDKLEEAERIAAIARKQKEKEPGGDQTTVEIITEGEGQSDGWVTRFRFEQTSTGAESLFQMKKTPAGIMSRYLTMSGDSSPERPKAEMKRCVEAWIACMGAWLMHQIEEAESKETRKNE